jgi:di/tricarboxylate transporter
MVISGFINDTPVLVLAMPIILDLARRVGMSASRTLMPVNAAILIGGMATTIGTSTNVLVISLAAELGLQPIGVFAFTEIVAVAAAIAFPYLWLVMPRLLPSGDSPANAEVKRFRAVLHVGGKSRLRDRRPAELAKALPAGLRVIEVRRGAGGLLADEPIAEGDELVVEGASDALREASESLKLALAPEELMTEVAQATDGRADRRLIEMAIGSDSALVGRSVRDARLAERFGVVVVGTYRGGDSRLLSVARPDEQRLEVGDLLLVQGTEEQLQALQDGVGALQLVGGHDLPRSARAPMALLIMAAVILLAATQVLPIAIAALGGSIAMLATGCVRYENLGRALSVEVIVLVAASIALGRTLVDTGAADWLAAQLAVGLQGAPPALALAAMMLFAAVLTNFVSNAAAAAIGTPLAMSLATALAIPAEPMVLAVLFGCNLCYVTPMAYQTNLLIMGAAGYSFRDFVRAGTPLAVIMIVTLAYLLVRRYGL